MTTHGVIYLVAMIDRFFSLVGNTALLLNSFAIPEEADVAL